MEIWKKMWVGVFLNTVYRHNMLKHNKVKQGRILNVGGHVPPGWFDDFCLCSTKSLIAGVVITREIWKWNSNCGECVEQRVDNADSVQMLVWYWKTTRLHGHRPVWHGLTVQGLQPYIVVAHIDNARSSDFLPFHQVSLINVLCAFIDPTFALRMCSFVLDNFCSLTSFKTPSVRPSRPLASNYTQTE